MGELMDFVHELTKELAPTIEHALFCQRTRCPFRKRCELPESARESARIDAEIEETNAELEKIYATRSEKVAELDSVADDEPATGCRYWSNELACLHPKHVADCEGFACDLYEEREVQK